LLIFVLWFALEKQYILVFFIYFITYIAQLFIQYFMLNKIRTSSIKFKCDKSQNISIKIYQTPCASDGKRAGGNSCRSFSQGEWHCVSIVLTRETSCFVSTAHNIRKFKVSERISHCSIYYVEMNCGIVKFLSIITDRSSIHKR